MKVEKRLRSPTAHTHVRLRTNRAMVVVTPRREMNATPRPSSSKDVAPPERSNDRLVDQSNEPAADKPESNAYAVRSHTIDLVACVAY